MTKRCDWCGDDPLYVRYHDTEWGKPQFDSRKLWECLCLETFQAGLSWITVLRKRENFRVAFDQFDPVKVSQYGEPKISELLDNAGIIRHRGKIEATIQGAQAYLKIDEEAGFSNYIWSFVDNKPIHNMPKTMDDISVSSPIAKTLSKDLKSRGFKFVGPTIVYAFMQAVGMVNDHLVDCHFRKSDDADVRSI